MFTEAKKIQQAYEEGKAYRQPEIDALKTEVAELKRQLQKKVAITPNDGSGDDVDPSKPMNPEFLLNPLLNQAGHDDAANHSIS